MSEQKQPLTHRQVFMLSEAEVTAIDDWRFKRRIPTRARALRELIEAGLLVSMLPDRATEDGERQ